jgi:hypothetical protein
MYRLSVAILLFVLACGVFQSVSSFFSLYGRLSRLQGLAIATSEAQVAISQQQEILVTIPLATVSYMENTPA